MLFRSSLVCMSGPIFLSVGPVPLGGAVSALGKGSGEMSKRETMGAADVLGTLAATIHSNKYAHTINGRKEKWAETAARVTAAVIAPYATRLGDSALVDRMGKYIYERKFMPGGRYLSSAGRQCSQVNNCFLFSAEDSSEGWADLMYKATAALMSGGGIGAVYSKLRCKGTWLSRKGGHSTGPLALMQMVNESGRHIMQGGSRRSAIWAGLHWNHKDIFEFIKIKDWSEDIKRLKLQDFNFPGPLDGTNISVILDDDFFDAYYSPDHQDHYLSHDVYWQTVRSMLVSGEPGLSVDIGQNEGEHLRNACCEVTSRDDSDMCNLGSINLARVESIEELHDLVDASTAFLLCGTLYSTLPVKEMYKVREKNRRLGLGLMGVHEWLLTRGKRYGVDADLEKWLNVYSMSGSFANRYADKLGVSRPVATRSIAPTGTISMVAETTSGIEPIPAVAYKRRYLDGTTWKAQYKIDSTAQRLIASGVRPDMIEDSLTLAQDVERRMVFQAWMQKFVDHGISSTINLPPWGTALNNEGKVTQFGNILLQQLPLLRGITAYPDGSRGGQPITRVPYEEAISMEGVEFVDNSEQTCSSGVCAS